MNSHLSRRFVLGALAAGAAAWAGGPALRAAADPLDYTSRAAFDLAEQAFFDQGFDNNETGGYAWGASYYLLGLMRMYEAYDDVEYLDRFERYARTVMATTDRGRHVRDYRGRSGWVRPATTRPGTVRSPARTGSRPYRSGGPGCTPRTPPRPSPTRRATPSTSSWTTRTGGRSG